MIGIGEILRADNANDNLEDPCFCLALDSHAGWKPSLSVTNSIIQFKSTILIDYNFQLIYCRHCLDISHYIRNCLVRRDFRQSMTYRSDTRHQMMQIHRPPQAHPLPKLLECTRINKGKQQVSPRKKDQVDEHGFQEVISY